MNHNNSLDYAPDSDTDTSKLLRPAIEAEYKVLATDLIDLAVENKLYWLAESGFKNASHLIFMGEKSKLDRGYWELVYTSIASNIDSYNITLVGWNK